MVPVGSGVRREYADMHRSFTCCVGTGMESHALHGLGLYYESGDKLWVNIYAPSTAQWESAGVKLTMETSFPEGESATLTLDLRAPKAFTLALRRPSWAGTASPCASMDRRSRSGCAGLICRDHAHVEVRAIADLADAAENADARRLRDNPKKAAVLWGPLVLAGDLGAAPRRRDDGDGDGVRAAAPEPVALVTDRPVTEWLKPVAGKPGVFRASGVARTVSTQTPIDVEFSPFFSMHRRTYAAYWDVLSTAD